MNHILDIDKLHRIAYGDYDSIRGQGHTLLRVTYLASLVSIQEPVVYCVFDKLNDFYHLKYLIKFIFSAYDLPTIQWYGFYNFECNSTKVFFVRYCNNGDNMLKGIPYNAPIVMLLEEPNKINKLIAGDLIDN